MKYAAIKLTSIKDKKNVNFFEGHSLIVCDEECLHIENNTDNKFVISKINGPSVFSNNGMRLKDAGYTKGKKGLSSFLRKKNIEMELFIKMILKLLLYIQQKFMVPLELKF